MKLMPGICIVLLTALLSGMALSAPSVGTITDNASSYANSQIPRYEKYEATFSISGVGVAGTDYNPYNPNLTTTGSAWYQKQGIYVDALITKPDGTSTRWPCFWNGSSWKFRFSPTATGTWSYQILVKHSSGTFTAARKSFVCVTSSSKGFLSVDTNDRRYFKFSNGQPFYPLGIDVSGGGSIDDVNGAFPLMGANGANYTRVFRASYQLEQSGASMLNNYSQTRCQWHDNLVEKGRENGIYIQLLLDDWTRWKGLENPYIAQGIVSSVDSLWGNATCIEVYKRKLRYCLARWGYSSNLLAFDLINEVGAGGSASCAWHKRMGDFIHGVLAEVPTGWGGGGQQFSYTAQPHMATSDETSTNLRVGNVPWNDPSMAMVNYHDYARPSIGWTGPNGTYKYEKLGSTIDYMWKDTAVWMDRLCRVYRRYNWNKPFSWTEFGLITGSWADDTANYTADTGGRHYKDCMWAGIFAGCSLAHWKQKFFVGDYGGGSKWWITKPASNFLVGEDMRGLGQETYYPVADALNPSPRITCTNGKIMIIAMRGTNKAYFYVKNTTDTWWRACGHTDGVPTPASQTGTMQLKGMTPGQYVVEKWSTRDTNISTQRKSTEIKTVGSDGIMTLSLSVSTGTDFDWAYKVKPSGGTAIGQPKIGITLTANKVSTVPGDIVTYTVRYTNTGTGSASNVVISVPLPNNTAFVSASNGGTYSSTTRKITWNVGTVAAGATGTVTFQAKVL